MASALKWTSPLRRMWGRVHQRRDAETTRLVEQRDKPDATKPARSPVATEQCTSTIREKSPTPRTHSSGRGAPQGLRRIPTHSEVVSEGEYCEIRGSVKQAAAP